MKLKIAALMLGLAAVPAVAQASPGDVAAHQSNQAAKRKFAKVTPDTWKHVEGKCRWTSTWKYWHCTSRVDGEHGYHGEFRVLVNHATLKAYVRGFTVTA